MRPSSHKLLLATALIALAAPPAAFAGRQEVIRDCADNGKLDEAHSRKDLRKARNSLPSDIDEYTDCSAVIAAALAARRGGSDGRSSGLGDAAGGGGGGRPPAAGGRGAAEPRREGRAPGNRRGRSAPGTPAAPIADGTEAVAPQGAPLFRNAASNGLPLPMLFALIGVLALGAAGVLLALKRRGVELGGAGALRERLPEFRRAARRLIGR